MDPNAVLKLNTGNAPARDIEDTMDLDKQKKPADENITIHRTGCPFFYGYKKEEKSPKKDG